MREDSNGPDDVSEDGAVDTDGSGKRPTRRDLLKLGASGVITGMAGCALVETDRRVGEPTPARSPETASDRATEFEPQTPRLKTPWSDDIDPTNPHPEYPRPQLTRERWRSLNGVWGFRAAEEGERPPVGEKLDESVLVPFPIESPLSGVGRSEPHMWYRRTFTVPSSWDERVLLHFEAVDFATTVHVNGQAVGQHEGGYDSFALDITDALDEDGDQELVVGVFDPTDDGQQPLGKQRHDPGGIYYTSCSGIWEPVWLEPVPDPHVGRLDLTPDLAAETLRLTVEQVGDAGTTVRARAFDDGSEVGTVTGDPGEELALPVPDPHHWSPDDPFLYDLEVELLVEDDPVDAVGSYFGMRSVGMKTVKGAPRLTLNGEVVFHMGTLDQGYWPDGIYTAPTDEALRFDLEAHVDLGFNAVRKHVKVEPRRWYYWADRLGLLVWQDMPSSAVRGEPPQEPAREQFETELDRMIDGLDNHPSVVLWVAFNEGWGAFDVPRIVESIQKADPTRPVDAQSGIEVCRDTDRICGPRSAGDVVDRHIYPGPGPVVPTDDQTAVLGEYGGVGLPIDGHLWNPDEEYSYASAANGEELTDSYVDRLDQVRAYTQGCGGLAAAFYTQLTDVEREINGLFTYDRQVRKVDAERVRAAHDELFTAANNVDIDERNATPTADGDLTGVGYWPLDEGEGTVATDEAGDNDARFRDLLGEPPRWTDGRIGGAVVFDGNRDTLDTGTTIVDTERPFSVAAWVRPAELGTDRTAVSQDGTGESAFSLGYREDAGRFAFSVSGTAVVDGPPVETGQWYHLAGTVVNCRARLFVDGEAVGSARMRATPVSDGPLIIGRGQEGSRLVDHWAGAIDEVHVYNRPLSNDEIRQLADEA
ncbi:LamG-like jellyroll fold domain-containing protein [Halorhabdus amylolytica]|uniref:LamG-like jellyroll fold domain-containing protein n=1 Tax=Halorhabdus amylolytica TaxID=2559573 RepID=UPI001B7D8B41|nr:LamG-like jellyroll fold domain-containing protein [Halorhabdus amylolytica]